MVKTQTFSTALVALVGIPQALEAQAAAGQAPGSFFQYLISMLPMFILVWFVFYVIVIRPQEKRTKSQQGLLKGLKKGDMVVTSSGLIGRVAGIEKDYILLELSPGANARVEAQHIVRPYEPKPADGGSGKKA